MSNICIIRSGHLGDVIMTEPTARAFQERGDQVYLATDYPQAAILLDNTYSGFIKTDDVDNCGILFTEKILLNYELSPELSYVEGFAKSAGIALSTRQPIINSDWKRIDEGSYILIAPHTSSWIKSMRNWGFLNYQVLKERIEKELFINCVILDDHHSFVDMLSLIRHCEFLVGNDSAPNIIGQCFDKKTFTIFGATHPKYVFFSKNAESIHRDIECLGCKHKARHTKIQCASPLCLTDLTVERVFAQIKDYVITYIQ